MNVATNTEGHEVVLSGTTDEALRTLRSTRAGLSSAEASRRFAEFGANQVERIRREPLVVQLAREFIHLFAIVLWIAAGLGFVADVLQPHQGMATLGWAVVAVIIINGLFSFAQVYQAERTIESLRKMLPSEVVALRDGRPTQMDTARLVPGDVIVLSAGDRVPADCLLIEATDVRVDMSTVSGEALPKSRYAEVDEGDDLLQRMNVMLAGTSIVQGRATGVVFATGMRTEFGRIAHLTQAAGEPPSSLQREIARLSRVVAALAALLGLAFFALGRLMGLSFWDNLIFAIGIIVANVPEGLLPTVTLAMAMASQRMAQRNMLVRRLPAVEALGAATVICADKTGTLTENRMRAQKVFVAGHAYEATAFASHRDLGDAHRHFFEVAVRCEDALTIERQGRAELVGDPMELALIAMGRQALGDVPSAPKIDEIPFDSDRKRLATLHDTSQGRVLYVKGAPEVVLSRCTRVDAEQGLATLTHEELTRYRTACDAMAQQGLRVIAFAYRFVRADCPRERWEEDLVLAGLVGLEDPPRPEVPSAIETCRNAGIRVVMITGDHADTACAIARQIGLVRSDSPVVISGADLRQLSDTQLQLALGAPDVLFARMGPEQKLRIVRALQQKRHVVAVTGDGVNDAPALRTADVGIAMGLTGTDVAKDAADMILLDDNFATIVRAIEEGRGVFDNIRKFLTYILTSNIPELVPYLTFALFRIPLALTIIQILAVDLGTDIVPALGLGAEPPERDVMQRPPRARTHRLVDARLIGRAYLFLGVAEAVAAMSAFFFVLSRGAWHVGSTLASCDPLYQQATAACLTAIVLMQVVNVYLCRSNRASTFAAGAFRNRLITAGVAVEITLLLAIVYTPLGQMLFATAAVPAQVWLFVLPFAVCMLLLEETRKLVMRIAGGAPEASAALPV